MELPVPDKAHKKVTKACNTCRLKRKKCNGLHPCLSCTESKIECSYAGEPKRRGPPSGYLRYMETRIALFEVLLGLFISRTTPASKSKNVDTTDSDPFEDVAETLLAESKSCTQDVWDGHRNAWVTCRSAKVIDDMVLTFAPYNHRHDHEIAPRPLLPSASPDTAGKSPDAHPMPQKEVPAASSAVLQDSSPTAWTATPDSVSSPASSPLHPLTETEHAPTPAGLVSKESFERYRATLTQRPLSTEGFSWPQSPPPFEMSPFVREVDKGVKTGRNAVLSISSIIDGDPFDGGRTRAVVVPEEEDQHDDDATGPPAVQESNSETGSRNNNCTSIPSQDLAEGVIDSTGPSPGPPSGSRLELPPPDVLSKMIDIYYNVVWPSFPLLPTRPTLETLVSSVPVHSDAFTTVLLALCTYCGCLSPREGEVGAVTPELWYEQARYGAHVCIKRGSSVEVAQALLLLAMTDYGRGNENQAWLILGVAIRVGQDVDLNGDLPNTYAGMDLPQPEIRLRKNIWRIALMLDLFLSLQLSRPLASFHCLRLKPKYDVQKSEFTGHPVPVFLHTVILSQIISRIYLLLYLGWDTPTMQTWTVKLSSLRDELETWYQLLPAAYHIPTGNQPAGRDIFELHLLYHAANILLYYPFSKDEDTHGGMEALIRATATFDELLGKYFRSPNQVPASPGQRPPLPNPNIISHIFTAAIANLSIHRIRQRQFIPENVTIVGTEKFDPATQSHLSHCLEALSSVGTVWGLARKYSQKLYTQLEREGLKSSAGTTTSEPTSSSLGKRRREEGNTTDEAKNVVVGGVGS